MKKFLIVAVALIAAIFIFLTVYKKQPVSTVATEQVQDMAALETQTAPEATPEVAPVDVTTSADVAAQTEAPAN